MYQPGSICISNVTGPHAIKVNGVYELTDEVCSGLPVFQKKTESDIWVEYSESRWRVLSTPYRGTTSCYVNFASGRPCLPQDCVGEWRVDMSNGFEFVSAVTVTLLSALPSHLQTAIEEAQLLYDNEVSSYI